MGNDRWIVVPNWDRFQHYGDRGPVWIKVYLSLNSDDDWLHLSCAARGLLTTIWVEYARSNARVRQENIRRLCGSSAREKHWEELNHAGFIQFSASKPSRARSREVEVREEEEKTSASKKGGKGKPKNQRAAENWIRNGLANEVPLERLGDVITDEFRGLHPDVVAMLVEQAKAAR